MCLIPPKAKLLHITCGTQVGPRPDVVEVGAAGSRIQVDGGGEPPAFSSWNAEPGLQARKAPSVMPGSSSGR